MRVVKAKSRAVKEYEGGEVKSGVVVELKGEI